jgi:hypothetical protein
MTKFTLAENPKDYAACRRLLKELKEPNDRFGYPTICAWDETGKLKAYMATAKRKDMVLATARFRRPNIILLTRLVNAYESYLAVLGIKFYWFEIENTMPDYQKLMVDYAERYGNLKQIGESETSKFYQRDLYAPDAV